MPRTTDIPASWKATLAMVQAVCPTAVLAGGSLRDLDNITKDFVDSARLDTLRLFFWRKLQKNERIELLISLDLLSPRALDRVPSAVERRAFEEAKEMGCLHKLWAGVMEKASPADRLDNPFGADE